MSIDLVRDPENPLGGHALMVLEGVAADMIEARIRIKRLEDDMVLGLSGWSPVDALIGPFPLEHAGGRATLRLGPDVVNAMEPFQRLQIDVPEAGLSESKQWPDNIRPVRQATRRGGLKIGKTEPAENAGIGGGRKAAPIVNAPAEPPKAPEPAPQPEPASSTAPQSPRPEGQHASWESSPPTYPAPAADPAAPSTSEPAVRKSESPGLADRVPPKKKSPLVLIGGAVAVVAIAAVIGIYLIKPELFGRDATEEAKIEPVEDVAQESPPRAEEIVEQSPPAPLTETACDPASVAGAGPEERWAMAQTCIAAGEAGSVQTMVQQLMATGHAEAAYQLALWNDPGSVEPSPIASPNPTVALRLYSDAAAAGVEGAEDGRAELCESLRGVNDLNAEMAVQKFCEEP